MQQPPAEVLKSWRSLNLYLKLTLRPQGPTAEVLDELEKLIVYEEEHSRRVEFLLRLYGFYSRVRYQSEREALLRGALWRN